MICKKLECKQFAVDQFNHFAMWSVWEDIVYGDTTTTALNTIITLTAIFIEAGQEVTLLVSDTHTRIASPCLISVVVWIENSPRE